MATKKPIVMTGFDVSVEFVLQAEIPISEYYHSLSYLVNLSAKPYLPRCHTTPAGFVMPSKMINYSFCHKRANTANWPADINDADNSSVMALSCKGEP